MRPTDLPLLRQCGTPSLSPDGSWAVTSVVRPDTGTDEYVGGLWLVRTDGSAGPRPLTRGHRDTSPAVSPDGRYVAFLRAEPKGRPQLHLLELDGGEPLRLTDHHLGAGDPVWSPDSRRIAYTARVPEDGRYGTQEGVGPDAEPPRLVTTLAYREDGLGYTRDRRPHVFVLDVPDLADATVSSGAVAEPRRVTHGDVSHGDVAWTPDGAALLVVADAHDSRDTDLRRGVYRVPADGGDLTLVVGGDLTASAPVASPDGRTVWFIASEVGPSGTDFVARNAGLFTAPLAGGPAHRLTDAETVDLTESGRPVVTERGVLVADRSRGAVRLLAVPADGGDPHVLLDGELQVRGVDATADGRTVVAVVADPTTPGDLVALGAGATTRLTDVAAPLRAAGVRPLVELTVEADDGYPVHGWAVLPDPARWGDGPHPVLLTVHGGPYAQYGWGLFDEAQVYAGAGYAVLMCNPRGSAGYGQAHGRVVQGAMGTRDADDVLQFLDGALGDPRLPLDRDRVGVQGGSYGGYMTALLTTRTDRFTGAVVERGYLDATSFVGSADIGWFFPLGYHGSAEAMREQSPMTHVERVTTPTLVIHSENDWRCPVEQGQRWFTALRLGGVRTELLLFPGEGHELSRSGRPRHRQARFEHVLRWWSELLPVSPADPAHR
ncbi:S9 family peptidase [Kineosporiaceae bacterium SCSIO 59966]|nr:S9 family peptidase [Kineosporiaceae bacterium SCSIO 59966]